MMPMTAPDSFSSGPPELPAFAGACVWIAVALQEHPPGLCFPVPTPLHQVEEIRADWEPPGRQSSTATTRRSLQRKRA